MCLYLKGATVTVTLFTHIYSLGPNEEISDLPVGIVETSSRPHRGLIGLIPCLQPTFLIHTFENHSDIGVFAKLTYRYCLAAIQGSTNFYSRARLEM
jgi:hypothetical protein